MPRPKIGVVGAGFVGSTTAQRLLEKNLGDVVLTDVVEGMPQGKALDLLESAPVEAFDARIRGSNTTDDLAGCDVVVVTAGLARKPGMTREDLLDKNAGIVGPVMDAVKSRSPNAVVVMVTNPLDVMTQLALRRTGFPKNRVVGMAGVLDSARFAYFIAEKLGVSVQDIRTMVLGGHGDMMVPMPRYTTVSGIPLSELMSAEEITALSARTRDGGAEIVALLKQGSAYYAPSSSITAMVASILRDERRLLPVCAYLEGEYGVQGVCTGVPAILGRNGIEKIVPLKLTPDESAQLRKSADKVRESTNYLKI